MPLHLRPDPGILAVRNSLFIRHSEGAEDTKLSQPQQLLIASDGSPARPTGPWVHEKKYYITRYLDIFSRGVGRKWAGQISYVDLFAGPGRSIVRGTSEEVLGSPFWALERGFAHYVFVDVEEVLKTLTSRLVGHVKFKQVKLIPGDCNLVVEQIRTAIPSTHLTLAFIDPTGLHIHFETIRRLVRNRRVDLLMTIQFGMGITMNLRQYLRTEGEALTRFLGTPDWRTDFEAGGAPADVCRRVLSRYKNQLRSLDYQVVEDREIPVRTDRKVLLYSIVLASRHSRGLDFWLKATEIPWSGQRRLAY
jgi:three-Cys-motif partner protein